MIKPNPALTGDGKLRVSKKETAGLPWERGDPAFFIPASKVESMGKKDGFSLYELLVVIAIIAVVSAITAPNIISWRNGAKLRGAADNLKGDLEMTKIKAVKENNYVVVYFFSNRYEIFLDNGEGGGTAGDWMRNGTEQLLRNRALQAGVTFGLSDPDWGFVANRTRFNGRGRPVAGTAVLVNTKGDRKKIILSTIGRIRIE